MSIRQLLLFALLLVGLTFVLSAVWSFGLEDLLDPYLPGDHVAENDAERWEFVIITSLLVATVVGLMVLSGLRTLRTIDHRQQVEALVFEGFHNDLGAAFTADGERTIVAENDRCRELLGPHFGPLIGRSFHDLLPIDLTDTSYLELEIGLRDHSRWQGVFVVAGKLGDMRLTLSLVMMQSPAGVATSLHGRVRSIEPLSTSMPGGVTSQPDAAGASSTES